MKKLSFISAFFLIMFCSNLRSQTKSGGITSDLEGKFSRIRENIGSREKLVINDSIREIIEKYAVSDSVFNHKFSTLRFLGQITSPDSLVKIISWNLILDDGGNRYFCYFVKRSEKGGKSELYKL